MVNKVYMIIPLALALAGLLGQHALATSQVSPQLAAEGVKIVVVKGVKCVDINGTLSDCDPAHGWSTVGNGTLVGISHPEVPPMPQLDITTATNMTITTPPINANARSNEHDYKWGFKDAVNDYNGSTNDSGDLDVFVAINDDVYDCQVKHSEDYGGKTHIELTGITNSTACRDGYVDGWKSWCKSNGLDCAYWAASGIVPSLVAQAEKVNRCVTWSFCLDRQHLINGYEQALYDKGLALGHLGNHTGAIEYFDKALAIKPHDVDVLNDKGAALDKLGNYSGAIGYYDKALAINPRDEDALTNKGSALDKLGNHTGAIEYYDKALAIQYNTYVLDNKAVALNNLGNHTGAVLYYNEALAIDQKDTFALTNKAAILDRLGNHATTGNLTTSQPQNLSTSQATNETTSGNATTSTVIGPNLR